MPRFVYARFCRGGSGIWFAGFGGGAALIVSFLSRESLLRVCGVFAWRAAGVRLCRTAQPAVGRREWSHARARQHRLAIELKKLKIHSAMC